jgi:hypothetical protein
LSAGPVGDRWRAREEGASQHIAGEQVSAVAGLNLGQSLWALRRRVILAKIDLAWPPREQINDGPGAL